jgi:uncharacterized protein (TIGR02466 family)
MFNNIVSEPIFSSFIFSSEFDIDNNAVLQECLLREKIEAGLYASNKGGFHSTASNLNDPLYPALQNLANTGIDFANEVCKQINITKRVGTISSWININRSTHYNVMHSHNTNILTGVYYVKVPENSNSNLILYRNDGADYFDNAFSGDFILKPEAGRMYIFSPWLKHSVTVNDSTDERISIAFNFMSTDKAAN